MLLVAVLCAWLLTLGLAYRAGTAEQAARAERLQSELGAQGEIVRDVSRRAAMTEAALAKARAELASLQAAARPAATPSAERVRLTETIERRLREGLTLADLQAAVVEARPAWRCPNEPSKRQLTIRTPAMRDTAGVRFTSDKVAVSGTGAAAKPVSGRSRSFDPQKPVTLRFEIAGSPPAEAAGILPLAHTVRSESKEYRFAAKAAERPGLVEIALTVCLPG